MTSPTRTWQNMPLTEARAVVLLARRFGFNTGHFCFPNVHVVDGEMDLAVVTKSRYLWEVEVKLTASDWRADARKAKWQKPRPLVSRFFYAVAAELIDDVPEFVPESAGLIAVYEHRTRVVRDARRKRGDRVSDELFARLLRSTYYRFWEERVYRHHKAATRKAAA